MTIRTRLIIYFLLVALLPFFATTLFILNKYRKTEDAAAQRRIELAADEKLHEIESFFDHLERDVKVVSDLGDFCFSGEGDASTLQSVHDAYGFENILLLDAEGRIMGQFRETAQKKGAHWSGLAEMPVTGAIGEVRYSRAVMSGQDPVPHFFAMIGLYCSPHASNHWLVVEVSLQKIYDMLLAGQDRTRTGESFIVQADSDVVRFLSPLRFGEDSLVMRPAEEGESCTALRNAAAGKTGCGCGMDYRGEQVIWVWRYFEPLNWGVLTKSDLSEAFADVRQMERMNWMMMVGVGVLVALLAVYVSRSFSGPLKKLLKATEQTAHGHWGYQVMVNASGEFGELARSLNSMAGSLQEAWEKDRAQNWLNEGHVGLSDCMHHEKDMENFCSDVIRYLAQYLKVQAGAFFLNRDGEYKLIGSYAYAKPVGCGVLSFRLGEGLIGQVAQEEKTILVEEIPADSMMITSALGETLPRAVLCFPISYGQVVEGVVELASTMPFSPLQREFIEQVQESIAVSLHSCALRARSKLLLENTRNTAEELQASNEELQAQEEELRAAMELMKGREHRMNELKEEVNSLCAELERAPVYALDTRRFNASEQKESNSLWTPAEVNLFRQTLKPVSDLVGVSLGIVSADGEVIVVEGACRICSEFHRQHSQTLAFCHESDTRIANHMKEGGKICPLSL